MNKGFTLIELIIVIAIISILAAIIIPLYQRNIAETQIVSAVAELNGAKSQYELIINNGSTSGSNEFIVPNMFFSGNQSSICVYDVNEPDISGNSNQALVCKFINTASVLKDESVYLNRNKDGAWSCMTSAGVDDQLKPIECH
ncbi:pilin [Acinetobacter pragensis]|uniref:pilin n=1 Tax=Acinetobacter pragensis TaxID=1806892 RepID=UPI00334209E2